MNDKQKCLLNLLVEFDQICKDNQIEYALAGGSMLGAIRHKGFIPWDDDVDVFVTKKNFDKLKKFFDENTFENRVFVHRWNNKKYPMIIARYYATDNTSLQRATAWDYMPAGQYIDIMIMIPMPKDETKHDKFLEDGGLYVELNNEFYADNIYRDRHFMNRYRFWNMVKKVFGKEFVMNHFEKKLFQYDDDTCEYYMISHSVGSLLKYPREVVRDTVYVDFETKKMPVNSNYLESFWYGYGPDWRKMPPFDERAQHKLFDDYDRPYQVYIDDYMRFIDKDVALEKSRVYKNCAMEDGAKRKELYTSSYDCKSSLFAIDFLKYLEDIDIDFEDALQRGELRQVYDIFLPYYDMQFSNKVKMWGSFIDIGDEYLYVFCYVLIYFAGEYRNAKKLLGLREGTGRPHNSRLDKLEEVINQIEELYHTMDFEDEEALRTYVDSFSDKDIQVDFCLAEMRLLASEATDGEGIETLYETARRRILQFPNCWDFVGYLAVAYEKKGMPEAAQKTYRLVAEMSNNGELVRDLNAIERAGYEN